MNELPQRTLNQLRQTCTKRGWQLLSIDAKTWCILDVRRTRVATLECVLHGPGRPTVGFL